MITIWIVWYNAGYYDETHVAIEAIYDNQLLADLHCGKRNLQLESADTSDCESDFYEVRFYWVKEQQVASKLLI